MISDAITISFLFIHELKRKNVITMNLIIQLANYLKNNFESSFRAVKLFFIASFSY